MRATMCFFSLKVFQDSFYLINDHVLYRICLLSVSQSQAGVWAIWFPLLTGQQHDTRSVTKLPAWLTNAARCSPLKTNLTDQ